MHLNFFNTKLSRPRAIAVWLMLGLACNGLFAVQTKKFSGIDGLNAFQSRASLDPAIASVLSKWNAAIQFYLTAGINKFPPELAQEVSAAGSQVVFNKSQNDLDKEFLTSSSTNTQQPSSAATPSSSGTPATSSNAAGNQGVSSVGSSTTTNTSSTNGGSGSANSSSSGGSSGTTASGTQNTGATGGPSSGSGSGSSTTNSSTSSKNQITSYSVSTQFGRIIQALGGSSAGALTPVAAGGFINAIGSSPPPLGSEIKNPYTDPATSTQPSGVTITGTVGGGTTGGTSSGGTTGSTSGGGTTGGTSSGGTTGSTSGGGTTGSTSGGGTTGSTSGGGTTGSTSGGGTTGSTSGGGTTGSTSGGSFFNASANFSCSNGADGGQCVTYVRDQFENHPGIKGLKPLCTGQNGSTDCGARYAYIDNLWDLGFGKGLTPRNNSVIVWESNSGFGHMAAVYQVTKNKNGTYTLLVNDSNWNGDEKQMCAIPYVVDPSTKISYRNGNPNPKTLVGFIYGEPVDAGTDSGSTVIAGGTGTTGGTSGGTSTTGETSGGSGTTGGTSGGTNTTGGSAVVKLGLKVSSIVFREYATIESSVTNSQVIGTDISESDFIEANEQANSTLVSLYNAIKSDLDFQSIANSALSVDPQKQAPLVVLADDNQISSGVGIFPHYNPNTNELILGNTALSPESLDQIKSIAIHELAHSQQRIKVPAGTLLYGPDGNHFSTEVTSLKGAYVEGYGEFWQGYYNPDEWAQSQFGMSACGFRREDANSTNQNPLYNGQIAASALKCDDMIPWTELTKDDFFKIEGIIASILLEVALRIPDGFTKVMAALITENNDNTDSLKLLNQLGQTLSGEDNAKYLLILDVLTNFKFSLDELKAITGSSNLNINGFAYDQPIVFLENKTVRELMIAEAQKTVDHNGFKIKYNGFHALDKIVSSSNEQAILPRIDSRAVSKNTLQASKVSPTSQFFFAPQRDPAMIPSDINSQDDTARQVHNGY